MTISLKHAFQSSKADGGDPSLVQSSNWNAEHTLTAAAGKVLGRDTSGAGSVQELPIAVDTSGNVGIGTTSPGAKLTVASIGKGTIFGSTSALNFYSAWQFNSTDLGYIGNGSGVMTGAGTTDFGIGATGARNLCFGTVDAERMRIDSSGNVMINTTTTAGKLTVVSTTSTPALRTTGLSDARVVLTTQASGTSYYDYYLYNGTNTGSITSTGTTTAYNITSDRRLKHDIVDAPEASDLIDAIKIRSFKWNVDGSEQRYGMIAQELDAVAPEAVTHGRTEDDMMSVDYSKLVPMLIKEVQSLRARVAELEGK